MADFFTASALASSLWSTAATTTGAASLAAAEAAVAASAVASAALTSFAIEAAIVVATIGISQALAPKPGNISSYGPRLEDLTTTTTGTIGSMIPITYGTDRVSGHIIWATNIKETSYVEYV